MNMLKKIIIAFSFLTIFASPSIQANYFETANCNSNCYECSCNPLYECSWGLQFQAGARPIIWAHRGNLLAVDCTSNNPVVTLPEFPRFRKLLRTPWQVGGQLSYAMSCNTNVFFEFNYAQARGRDNEIGCNLSNLTNFVLAGLSKYRLFDAYVGTRYYFDRWCDRVSFFLGGKAGLIHHRTVHSNALILDDNSNNQAILFHKNTSFAGGAQLGLDICFCGNWSLVITGEVVASCGPQSVNAIALAGIDPFNQNATTNVILGHIETEIAFPITVGIKYNF